ncbi:MAG: SLC13 family permease [Candidatus Odinarchaeota archaeon]
MVEPLVIMIVFTGIFVITYGLVALSEEKKLVTILAGAMVAIIAGLFLLVDVEYEGHTGPFVFERIFISENYITWEVLVIITGMSLLVEALNKSHVFDFISINVIKLSKGKPTNLMFVVFYLTFSLSAILDNVTAMILVSSITMTVCKGLDMNPIPYFFSAIFATVTAGLATIVGSLPSILIGNAAGMSFVSFLVVGLPLSIALSILQVLYFKFVFRKELEEASKKLIDISILEHLDAWALVESKQNFYISMGVIGLVILGFIGSGHDGFINQLFGIEISIGLVAMICSILLIILTRADLEKMVKRVHWDTVLFFIGLFVLVGTLDDAKVLQFVAEAVVEISGGNILLLLIIIMVTGAVLSAFVSNIALSAAFIPVINTILIDLGNSGVYSDVLLNQITFFTWWVLLAAVTFGGGFTPLGTAPAVVAIGILKEEGKSITFTGFMKLMAPLSLLMLVASFFYVLFFGMFFV